MTCPIPRESFARRMFGGYAVRSRRGWTVELGRGATDSERAWLRGHGYQFAGRAWNRPDDRGLPNGLESGEFPELRPFERRVALMLVEDTSLAAIARRLGTSKATVSTAKWRLLTKLELEGLAGLTRLAIRRGYIAP